MNVPNCLIGLWLAGSFVERKDPGDDHRRENKHVGASSHCAKHAAASDVFFQDSSIRLRRAGELIFG
jgi:hypothetical protein